VIKSRFNYRDFQSLWGAFVERFSSQARSAPSDARVTLVNKQLRVSAYGGKLPKYI